MSAAPPVQRLEHWTLVCSDLEKTKHFYTEVMGAVLPERGAGPLSVNLGGTLIDLFPASEGRQPQPGSNGQHHAYIINLEDYDPWVEHLKGHGLQLRLATHAVERISIYVDDPDGYHLELTVPIESEETFREEAGKRGLLS
jgi:glyoxylase I family protein